MHKVVLYLTAPQFLLPLLFHVIDERGNILNSSDRAFIVYRVIVEILGLVTVRIQYSCRQKGSPKKKGEPKFPSLWFNYLLADTTHNRVGVTVLNHQTEFGQQHEFGTVAGSRKFFLLNITKD